MHQSSSCRMDTHVRLTSFETSCRASPITAPLIAPDFPGSGYSNTPDDYAYTFDRQSNFLRQFLAQLGIERYALYLHDFGRWISLRLALSALERVAALMV